MPLLNGSLNKRWGRENIVDEDVVVDRLMRECTYRNKRSILKSGLPMHTRSWTGSSRLTPS